MEGEISELRELILALQDGQREEKRRREHGCDESASSYAKKGKIDRFIEEGSRKMK